MQDTLSMCEVDFSFADNKKEFTNANIQSTLAPLLKDSFAYKLEESEMEMALGALNAGIFHMNLLSQCDTAQKQFSLKKYTLSQYLRLDVAALKSLNVFPQQSGVESGVSGQAGSIYGLLNQCKT